MVNRSTPSRSLISAGRITQGLLVSFSTSPPTGPAKAMASSFGRSIPRAAAEFLPGELEAGMVGGLERDRLAERRRRGRRRSRPARSARGCRRCRRRAICPHACSASIAASIAEAPASASSACMRIIANSSRPVPTGGGGELAGGRARKIDADRLERPASAHRGGSVAVANPRQRTVGQRFGRDVDGGGHLAARPGHAPVGDQRDLVARGPAARRASGSACAARACRWRAGPGSGPRPRQSRSSSPALKASSTSFWSEKQRAGASTIQRSSRPRWS